MMTKKNTLDIWRRNMKVLVDTNILIDYITIREPFYDSAFKVITLCADKKVKCAIAAHSIPTMYYLLRREMTDSARRIVIKRFLEIFDVALFEKDMVISALDREDFKDFEDCLQDECAANISADYIVTRNIKDYQNSTVPAITPNEFLKLI